MDGKAQKYIKTARKNSDRERKSVTESESEKNKATERESENKKVTDER